MVRKDGWMKAVVFGIMVAVLLLSSMWVGRVDGMSATVPTTTFVTPEPGEVPVARPVGVPTRYRQRYDRCDRGNPAPRCRKYYRGRVR